MYQFFLAKFILVFSSLAFTSPLYASEEVLIKKGFYNWEKDLKVSPQGLTQSSFDRSQWQEFSFDQGVRPEAQVIWQSFILPPNRWRDPSLFIHNVDQVFEVFLKGQLIYKNSEINLDKPNGFIGWGWHLIDLPNNFNGETIFFRIYSDHDNIGITGVPAVGSHAEFMKSMFDRAIYKGVVVIAQILVGTVGLFLFFFSYREERLVYMSTFVISLAIYYLCRIQGAQTIFSDLSVKTNIEMFSLFIMPSGLMFFLGTLVSERLKRVYKVCGSLFIAITCSALLSWLVSDTHPSKFLLLFQIALVVSLSLYIVGAMYLFLVRKELEMWIFAGAMILTALGGILDVFASLSYLKVPAYYSFSSIGMILLNGAGFFLIFAKLKREMREKTRLERVEKNRKIEEYKDKMDGLKTLAAGMSHEINNPLFVIGGNATQIKEEVMSVDYNPTFVLSRVEAIQKSVDKISEITEGMQLLAREEVSTAPFETSKIIDVVNLALKDLRNDLKNLQINLQIDSKCSLFQLECRKNQLASAFSTLFRNSIEAVRSGDDRWIKLELGQFRDSGNIRVVDSGWGIAEELVDKIMSPFFTTKGVVGKSHSVGLSLGIAEGIFEQHNGWLRLDSEAEHTTFVISLPLEPIENLGTNPKAS